MSHGEFMYWYMIAMLIVIFTYASIEIIRCIKKSRREKKNS